MDTPSISKRTFLQSVAGVGLVSSLASGNSLASSESADPNSLQLPEDPYITVAHGAPLFRPRDNYGWQEQSSEQRIETIRGLHPDLLDFHRLINPYGNELRFPPGVQGQLAFSKQEQLPATIAQSVYLQTTDEYEARIEGLREENEWELPSGEPVTNNMQLLGESFEGTPHGFQVQGGYRGVPSVFAPAFIDIQTFVTSNALDDGFVSMFTDSITTPRLPGLDFSVWAQAGFREHLRSLSDERLEKIGVSNPDRFDIRDALQNRGVDPDVDQHPASDPLFREYHLFHHRGLKSFTRVQRELLSETFPDRADDRGATLNANHYFGDSFDSQVAAAVYTTDHKDFITVEDNRTKPPEHVRELAYKLMLAAAREEKPVLFEGQMQSIPGNDSTRGLSLDRNYFNLRRFQFAEAYANGVPRKIPLTGWGNVDSEDTITKWVEPDGTVPEELQSFVDFLWTSQRYLKNPSPSNDVAVVFSMPTMLWHRIPQWDRNASTQRAAFRGVAKVLRESQIPYDVTIFGHPQLWTDEYHLNRLSEYEAIILPEVDCLTTTQAEELASFADSGGTIVTTGVQPNRTANFEPTSFAWLDHKNVTSLEESPLLYEMEEDDEGERDSGSQSVDMTLAGEIADVPSISVDVEFPIALNKLQNDEIEIVHILNYDYEEAEDTFSEVSNLTLTVGETDAQVAEYITPRTRDRLETEQVDNGLRVQVPSVTDWAFVVLGESPDDLAPSASIEEATTAVTQARELVSDIESIPELANVRLSTILDEAELALESNAADLAVERAEKIQHEIDRQGLTPAMSTDDSNSSASSDQNANTSDAAAENSTSSETSTDDEIPGFGVGAGLAGIVGGAALLKEHLTDEEAGEK